MAIIIFVTFGAVGSVLASNLTINSNQEIEFGQGSVVTTSCDSQVTFKPSSVFNSPGDGFDYRLNSFTFSQIDLSNSGCEGKWLVINSFTNSGIFSQYTTENSTQSELYTSCADNCGIGSQKFNSTIAIRFYEVDGVEKYEVALPSLANDALDLDFQFDSSTQSSSTFSIFFGYDKTPIPSQALTTLTLETYGMNFLPENLIIMASDCSDNFQSCII